MLKVVAKLSGRVTRGISRQFLSKPANKGDRKNQDHDLHCQDMLTVPLPVTHNTSTSGLHLHTLQDVVTINSGYLQGSSFSTGLFGRVCVQPAPSSTQSTHSGHLLSLARLKPDSDVRLTTQMNLSYRTRTDQKEESAASAKFLFISPTLMNILQFSSTDKHLSHADSSLVKQSSELTNPKQRPFLWTLQHVIFPLCVPSGPFRFHAGSHSVGKDWLNRQESSPGKLNDQESPRRDPSPAIEKLRQADEERNGDGSLYQNESLADNTHADSRLSPSSPSPTLTVPVPNPDHHETSRTCDSRQLPMGGEVLQTSRTLLTSHQLAGDLQAALAEAGFHIGEGGVGVCVHCGVEVPVRVLTTPLTTDPFHHALLQHLVYSPSCGYARALRPPQTQSSRQRRQDRTQGDYYTRTKLPNGAGALDTLGEPSGSASSTAQVLVYPVTSVLHGTHPLEGTQYACHTPDMRYLSRRLASFSPVMDHLSHLGVWAIRLADAGFYAGASSHNVPPDITILCFCCGIRHPGNHEDECLRREYNIPFNEEVEERHQTGFHLQWMVDGGFVQLRGNNALQRRGNEWLGFSLHEMLTTLNVSLREPSGAGSGNPAVNEHRGLTESVLQDILRGDLVQLRSIRRCRRQSPQRIANNVNGNHITESPAADVVIHVNPGSQNVQSLSRMVQPHIHQALDQGGPRVGVHTMASGPSLEGQPPSAPPPSTTATTGNAHLSHTCPPDMPDNQDRSIC